MGAPGNEEPVLEIERRFEWGLLILCDELSSDGWPELKRGAPFAASNSSVQIVVRHAQDTDADIASLGPSDPIPSFKVSVRCWVNTVVPEEVPIETVLDVPSGRAVLGDAEQWDVVELTPGAWKVRALTTPSNAPESVSLWFSGGEPAG